MTRSRVSENSLLQVTSSGISYPQLVNHPTIIQGGMGVAVSNWRLANAVCRAGGLGVVSGTALDQVLVRRLQDGDPQGDMRRALAAFPFRALAQRILDRYWMEGGKGERTPYRRLPMMEPEGPRELRELCIAANFVEVWLAKEGHGRPAGVNYLEKIQVPHLPSIYGALLAGVDYILMGAGIPLKIPGVLDALAKNEPAQYPLTVAGGDGDCLMHFDPADYREPGSAAPPQLTRPYFLAIVASNTLALTLARKANGRVDGFIVEGPTAGGHNAPPRGKLQLNEAGEPVYGERDRVDLARLRELGLPFWLAGGYGTPGKLAEAREAGAAGIQVGTAFAFCEESGFAPAIKEQVLAAVRRREVRVFTDPVASPTDFPFKCVQLAGTVSDAAVYASRPRVCDLGYLREAYRTADGSIGFRCAAEPVTVYASKGGDAENAKNRRCLCNSLMANVGYPQMRNGYREPGLITSGDGLVALEGLASQGAYRAADVMQELIASPITDAAEL